jgi:hypothetical protein
MFDLKLNIRSSGVDGRYMNEYVTRVGRSCCHRNSGAAAAVVFLKPREYATEALRLANRRPPPCKQLRTCSCACTYY